MNSSPRLEYFAFGKEKKVVVEENTGWLSTLRCNFLGTRIQW